MISFIVTAPLFVHLKASSNYVIPSNMWNSLYCYLWYISRIWWEASKLVLKINLSGASTRIHRISILCNIKNRFEMYKFTRSANFFPIMANMIFFIAGHAINNTFAIYIRVHSNNYPVYCKIFCIADNL